MRHTKEEVLLALEGRNGWHYNHMKALEELAELSEKLLKKLNKDGGPKEPTDREVIEEIGDVNLRLQILEYIYDPTLVRERERQKLLKWAEYLDTDKYDHI